MANEATSMHFADDDGRVGFSDGPNKRFTFGTGDWTIDFWGQTTTTDNDLGWFCYFKDSSNRFHLTNYSNLEFYCIVGGSDGNNSFTNAKDLHWHHYAVVRSGDRLSIFLDGILLKTTTFTLDMNFSGGTFYLGVRTDNGSNWTQYSEDVYMDEFRISYVARFGNIAIPTAPLNTWQTAGRGQNALLPHHTKLLIQSNSSSTSSDAIVDSTGRHTLTMHGHTTRRDSSYPTLSFANAAIYFDGTGDYISGADSADFDFSNNDWSIEMWINKSGGSGIFAMGQGSPNMAMSLYASSTFDVYLSSD